MRIGYVSILFPPLDRRKSIDTNPMAANRSTTLAAVVRAASVRKSRMRPCSLSVAIIGRVFVLRRSVGVIGHTYNSAGLKEAALLRELDYHKL